MAEFWSDLYRVLAGSQYAALLGLVFAATAAAVGAVVYVVLRRDSIHARLAKLVDAPKETRPAASHRLLTEEDSSGFVTRVATPLHKVAAPSDALEQKKIRLLLTQAGFRTPRAYRTYLALKVLLGLLFPAAYLFASFFYTLSPKVLAIAFLLGGVGFFLPTWAVRYLVQQRKQRINKALPDALDLMVVCAEAGLGLDMTLKRVGEEIRPMSKDLSDEYHLTNLEIKSGKPRNDSLKNMGLRTGVRDVGNLMTVLVQSSRFGTSIAQALRVHAEGMRVHRRQVAEEKAGKLMVKLMIPLVCFIFPVLFIVLIGPGAIRIAQNLLPVLGQQ